VLSSNCVPDRVSWLRQQTSNERRLVGGGQALNPYFRVAEADYLEAPRLTGLEGDCQAREAAVGLLALATRADSVTGRRKPKGG
jgi:hypothetical protein